MLSALDWLNESWPGERGCCLGVAWVTESCHRKPWVLPWVSLSPFCQPSLPSVSPHSLLPSVPCVRIRIYILRRAQSALWAAALSAPPPETPPEGVSPRSGVTLCQPSLDSQRQLNARRRMVVTSHAFQTYRMVRQNARDAPARRPASPEQNAHFSANN